MASPGLKEIVTVSPLAGRVVWDGKLKLKWCSAMADRDFRSAAPKGDILHSARQFVLASLSEVNSIWT